MQLSGITGTLYPAVDQKVVIVMAGDHGVYEEGVTGNPQTITYEQTLHISNGLTGVCALANVTGAKVVAVDVGVKKDFPEDCTVINRKIRYGTANMAKGPAMTREEADKSIEVGIEIANSEIAKGANVLATGEMGFAIPHRRQRSFPFSETLIPEITGKGAGLGPGGKEHKANVIRRAIEVNQPTLKTELMFWQKWAVLKLAAWPVSCSPVPPPASCRR